MRPTQEQIDEARSYLRRRLAAERSMEEHTYEALLWASRQIVDISYRYNIPPRKFRFSKNKRLKTEVDAVIRKLRDMLDDMTSQVVGYCNKDREDILVKFVHEKEFGMTFKQRLEQYTSRFRSELEVSIAAGLFIGRKKESVLNTIKTARKHPFQNGLISEAVKKGFNPIEVLGTKTSFGVGHTVSSWTGLDTLTNHTVARGWMHNLLITAHMDEAKGFYTFRNSRYPCQICDDYTRVLHPMSDPIPPIHPHCVCGVVFVK